MDETQVQPQAPQTPEQAVAPAGDHPNATTADGRLLPEDQKAPAVAATPGSCLRAECACIHEHGLVAVQNADGSFSQISTDQAKAQLDSLKKLEEQLGGQA